MKNKTIAKSPLITYYDKKFLDNLKAQTLFGRARWTCACGQPGIHSVEVRKNDKRYKRRWETVYIGLCDGCKFRHTVMKSAGREYEFLEDYEQKRTNCTENVQTRRPLPTASGKKIQMFTYKPVSKP